MITLFMNKEINTERKYLNMHVALLHQKLIYITFFLFFLLRYTPNIKQ